MPKASCTRSFIAAVVGVFVTLGGPAALAQPARSQQKPNILLIVSDDTGYGDLGPYGGG